MQHAVGTGSAQSKAASKMTVDVLLIVELLLSDAYDGRSASTHCSVGLRSSSCVVIDYKGLRIPPARLPTLLWDDKPTLACHGQTLQTDRIPSSWGILFSTFLSCDNCCKSLKVVTPVALTMSDARSAWCI